ncbi:uncharacterized protein LOC110189181 [Drosophila serrata]|uniref:uncharacterized protein LOC110189181 n=1 Tax=Drosophila serrata TaxID=7274 RepID=UPI000A1CFA05|nr:uncharacterized protein LOC110189181 [Drosophila serrata]
MNLEKNSNSPTTPTSSRSALMRRRKRSTPHLVTLLRNPGIAKELRELQYDEENEKNSSAVEAETSAQSTSQISDDSGIDVSQEDDATKKPTHSYTLRKRYKDPL